MKIRLQDIENQAKTRPPEYKDDVLSKGKIVGNVLEIDGQSYLDLVKKYSPEKLFKPVSGCCGKKTQGELSLPSLPTQIKNAAGAVARVASAVVNNKPVMATEDIVKERELICQGCEFLIKEKNRCSKCGCWYKRKISLATEHCPIQKW